MTANSAAATPGAVQTAFISDFQAYMCSALQMDGYCEHVKVRSVKVKGSRRRNLLSARQTLAMTELEVDTEVQPLASAEVSDLATHGKSPAASSGAMLLALTTPSTSPLFSGLVVASVGKEAVCGDGVCAPGETPDAGSPDTMLTCYEDCPFKYGTCPSPGSSEAGDPTKVR